MMADTEKQISSHFFNSVNLNKVRALLPPKHWIRNLDDSVELGLQKNGDYFVVTLHTFHGKKMRKDTNCMGLLNVSLVLEDGTTDTTKMECFLFGPYCEMLEKKLRADLDRKGTWNANKAQHKTKVVWIVLHRAFVVPSRLSLESWHTLSLVVGPKTGPDCEMKLVLGLSSTKPPCPYESVSSPSLIDLESTQPSPLPVSSSPPQPSSIRTTTPAISPDAQHPTSTSSLSHTKNPTSSTQASLPHSKLIPTHSSSSNRHSQAQVTSTPSSAPTNDLLSTSTQPFVVSRPITSDQPSTSAELPSCSAKPTVQGKSSTKTLVCDDSPDRATSPASVESPDRATSPASVESPDRATSPASVESPDRATSPASVESPDRATSSAKDKSSARVKHAGIARSSPREKSPRKKSSPQVKSSSRARHTAATRLSQREGSPPRRRSPVRAKSTLATRSPTKEKSQAKPPIRAKPTATAASSGRPSTAGPSPGAKKIKIQYRLKPLSQAAVNCKISAAAVVVDTVKMRQIASNQTVFDIIKVADEVTDPNVSHTGMLVKIFHNDKVDWPEDGTPEKGQVIVFKDMMCKEYKTDIDGILYTTKMACICKRDENNELTWYSHSQKSPHNIENADEVANKLFDWWAATGSNMRFDKPGGSLPSLPAATLPIMNISQVGGKGFFILYCQVLKKIIYPSISRPMAVLRVWDGTPTSFQFEEINYDPYFGKKVNELVFGPKGSLEVDILVKFSSTHLDLGTMEVDSFVELKWMDCFLMPGDLRKLILEIADIDSSVKVLEENDPALIPVKEKMQQARLAEEDTAAAEEDCDDVSSLISEESDGRAWLMRETPISSNVTPSPQPDLHTDSFEIFLRQDESHKRPPPDSLSPANKRQCVGIGISRMPIPKFPFNQTIQPSSNKQPPPPQPYSSTHVHSPQSSPIKRTIHSSPRQHLDSSSPPPTTSKEPLHPSPLQLATRLPQQCSSRVSIHGQTSSPISTHHCALEEMQQAASTDTLQTYPTRQIKFHTEVMGEAKETNLETFYYQGKIGEVHHVKAAITDIRIIAEGVCWCRGEDGPCLHQWVWGLCQRCERAFPSSHLTKFYSPLALNSLNTLQCKGCIHDHAKHNNGEDREQPVARDGEEQAQGMSPDFLTAIIHPFIKIKLEVEDLSSHFQLTHWLTGDEAHLFFGITPNFRWIIKEQEVMKQMVQALLEDNSSLSLRIVKKVIEGKVELFIVNTILHCNPPNPLPATSPHPESPLGSPPHTEHPPTTPPHTEHPPATPPHTEPAPATPPHTEPAPATPPHSESPPANPPDPQSATSPLNS